MSKDARTPEVSGDAAFADYSQAILEAVRVAKIGVCVTLERDGALRNVLVSDAAVEILGHPREVLLSTSPFEFIAPEERERLRALRERRLQGEPRESLTETLIVRANGTKVPIKYALTELTVGGRYTRVSFFWDITERRDTEEALRAEEARLRRLFESAPDGIVVSRDGVVLEANPAAARMLGFDAPHEAIGVSLHTLMSPVEARTMIERVAAAREGERLAPRTYEARRRDGTRVMAEVTSVPYEHEGKPAVMGFARDVTERARLHAQLVQAERLAALGTLAAGVAHEINNPLTVMLLGIQTLELRLRQSLGRLDAQELIETTGILEELRGGVNRVASIVGELRTFARTGDEPPAPVDVIAVLASAERMVAHQLRHRARVRIDHGVLPPAVGNARRLEQVIVNLLLNAAQAMPEGREENRIDVRAGLAADGRVLVEVEDNGPGMSPEVLSRVFDPFFTTKSVGEGTGLGLAISHGLVTRMGGEIVLDSVLGRGTTARVLLLPAPREKSEPRRLAAEPPAPARAARSRVLIVDDEHALGGSLRALLADDHDVTLVRGGADACRILLEDASYDVVLCDLMMPGVTGMDVHARLSAARPEIVPRIAFMTGGAFTPGAAAFLAAVPNRVLQKPFALDEVHRLIADLRRVP